MRYNPNPYEIHKICEEYRLGEVISIDGELGGLFNVNLKITTSLGSYVIRVDSGLSQEEHICTEKILLKKLAEDQMPVLTPLITKSGHSFLTVHKRFGQVTPFIQGVPFRFTKKQAY